jgi:DNA-binding PadR family transcriptional regulator
METFNRDPEASLPLRPAEFQILLALAERERHGYNIMQEIGGRTGRHIGPATLYRTIKRMLDENMIEESDERPDPEVDDERRRYYRITAFGRQVLAAEIRRFEVMVAEAKQIIQRSEGV